MIHFSNSAWILESSAFPWTLGWFWCLRISCESLWSGFFPNLDLHTPARMQSSPPKDCYIFGQQNPELNLHLPLDPRINLKCRIFLLENLIGFLRVPGGDSPNLSLGISQSSQTESYRRSPRNTPSPWGPQQVDGVMLQIGSQRSSRVTEWLFVGGLIHGQEKPCKHMTFTKTLLLVGGFVWWFFVFHWFVVAF